MEIKQIPSGGKNDGDNGCKLSSFVNVRRIIITPSAGSRRSFDVLLRQKAPRFDAYLRTNAHTHTHDAAQTLSRGNVHTRSESDASHYKWLTKDLGKQTNPSAPGHFFMRVAPMRSRAPLITRTLKPRRSINAMKILSDPRLAALTPHTAPHRRAMQERPINSQMLPNFPRLIFFSS